MKIIFNKVNAFKEKLKIEKAVKKENFKRTFYTIAICLAGSICLAAVVIAVFFTEYNFSIKGVFFALGILLAFAVPTLSAALKEDVTKTIFPSTRYTPEVRYLLATTGKELENIELKHDNDAAELFVTTKNAAGFTTKEFVCRLKKIVCEDNTDIVVDLQKATVYIPALCLTKKY